MAAYVTGLLKPWTPRMVLVRWSRYHPYYLEPELRKEFYRQPESELSAEEKEERQMKTVRPVKATANSVTSSVFYDPVVSKFTNMMMKSGNKILARDIMAKTMERIKRKQVGTYHKSSAEKKAVIECNPYKIFHQALENCMPWVGLITIEKVGRNYQVPIPLSVHRRQFFAFKWIITECRENKSVKMDEKLADELLNAYNNEGNVIKKKLELHKMAESNRAYAHFRWW